MKKTMRQKAKKDKSIRLREGERIHVGIDVHLNKNVLTLWSATMDYLIVTWNLSADPEAIARPRNGSSTSKHPGAPQITA